jgi:hypothetical protein
MAALLLSALGSMSCIPAPPISSSVAKPVDAVSPDRPAPGFPGESPASALSARPVDFETQVLPILQARCRPCHFDGGVMYRRLPFDCPQTIRLLGTKVFTRIRNEGEQSAINLFLAQSPDLDGEPAEHCRLVGPD